ncbi:MAG: sodium:solute symporter [Eubacteriales bacterium]|nr:sodium:solute symporter [Eubacteriales bacterium]
MLKYGVLGLFLLVMILVGLISYRKVQTSEDYVLGGRKIGPWLSAFSYGTTYFSAVVFVGYAGRFGWQFGLSATWIGIGNAVIGSLLAWLLLAERTRRISQAMQVSTMAEFFRKRYDSIGIERFAAVIIFIFLIPYSASVYQGLGYVMQRYFSDSILADIRISMMLIAIVTGVYLFFGGYLSTAINSLIQGLIMTIGVGYMAVRVVQLSGGFSEAHAALSAIQTDVIPVGSLVQPLGPMPFDLITLILMTSLGTLGLPQMIAKFNGIRDRVTVRRATIMSTLLALIIGGGAYWIGGFSRVLTQKRAIEFNTADLDTLMPAVFESILSPGLMAILIVLMMSASMSTLASVVLVSAPTFGRTILKKKSMLVMRLLSLLFVFISYLIAVIPSAIVTLMAFSWGAVSGAFIGPYIWGLYDRKATRAGAVAGMVSGLGTVIIGAVIILILQLPTGLWSPRLAVLAMLVSLVITPLASRLTRRWFPIPEGASFL